MVTGLVHDYLLVMRGAERTFAQIACCFPDAPIFTLLYDEERTGGAFADREVHSSFLQHLPVRQQGFRRLLPLFPTAIDRFALGPQSVVVSSSSAFAHGVRAEPDATHICYCHSPFRYVWHDRECAMTEVARPARPMLARQLERLRRWDLAAAAGVDHFIANSRLTQERIAEFWGRDSTVIHPPVDIERFYVGSPQDFFLVVGELVPHKRVGDVLLAAERAGRRVKIAGTGPELPRLRDRFGANAEFLGRVQDDHLADLMSRALAVVIGTVEEFGIVAVEAHAAGRPVVGPDRGGTSETIDDGVTGVLYPAHDVDALTEILREVDFERFDPVAARRSALAYRSEVFRERITREVSRLADAEPDTPRMDARRFSPRRTLAARAAAASAGSRG